MNNCTFWQMLNHLIDRQLVRPSSNGLKNSLRWRSVWPLGNNMEALTSEDNKYEWNGMLLFGAADLAPPFWRSRFGANTIWRCRYGANTIWRWNLLAHYHLAQYTIWRSAPFGAVHHLALTDVNPLFWWYYLNIFMFILFSYSMVFLELESGVYRIL